jgi:hypothetical protein
MSASAAGGHGRVWQPSPGSRGAHEKVANIQETGNSRRRALDVRQSLSLPRHRSDSIPGFLEAAQTAELAGWAVCGGNCDILCAAAFQKNNSTIGFIGFPPTGPVIIDQTNNLDESSI